MKAIFWPSFFVARFQTSFLLIFSLSWLASTVYIEPACFSHFGLIATLVMNKANGPLTVTHLFGISGGHVDLNFQNPRISIKLRFRTHYCFAPHTWQACKNLGYTLFLPSLRHLRGGPPASQNLLISSATSSFQRRIRPEETSIKTREAQEAFLKF